jgi:uncharacterized protein with PIN domain
MSTIYREDEDEDDTEDFERCPLCNGSVSIVDVEVFHETAGMVTVEYRCCNICDHTWFDEDEIDLSVENDLYLANSNYKKIK